MQVKRLDSRSLTRCLKGLQVSQAVLREPRQVILDFSDGSSLIVEACADGLLTRLVGAGPAASAKPTARQFEYLRFIAKYMQRFGRAPAESDIERHFIVSAPSVNQMMQVLERRGFIARQAGVPRSIRLRIALDAPATPGTGG